MHRIVPLLTLLLASGTAVQAGVFLQEIRHVFTTAQGLPSNDVGCVAVAGSTVYVGTARGLASYSGNGWHLNQEFKEGVVRLCTASSDTLFFQYGDSLYRLAAGQARRIGKAPGGARVLAARGQLLLVGTERGLYEIREGAATALKLPVATPSIRQMAIGPEGEVAVAADEGLFIRNAAGVWRAEHPRDGIRSWAPIDVRGVTYDRRGRLWFASPQGVGCREASGWKLFTGFEGLPYNDFTTAAAGEDGVVWFGTRRGAIRYDGKAWEYRQGRAWLPDDDVRSISVTEEGHAWLATGAGAGLIERRPMTLAEKAKFFEDGIDRRHRRTEYGYVMAVRLPNPGDTSRWIQEDSDNDGLWTSMYGAGECFAYAATKDPLAKKRARKAFEALRFLSQVTQGGEHPAPPGFPARAIRPTSGPDPNLNDSRERDLGKRANGDRLWKILSPRWPKSADGKWYWKTDTSSDELDGHYFFYAQYYDLVAETPQEKEEVRQVVRAITDHLLAHNYRLVDWDGQPTRWAIFDPFNLNQNRMFWVERGLNSLSILSYLKVAAHITGDSKYQRAYDQLVREHHFATNAMVAKISAGPGSGNQSDDEMAFMCFYNLLKYETEPELVQRYAVALANYWALERPELNPFFNFVAAASLRGKSFESPFRTEDLSPQGDWLEESIDTLRRLKLDQTDWRHTNRHRIDIVPLRTYFPGDDEEGTGWRRNGKVIPVDERSFLFWNHNPYRLDTGSGGHRLGDGAVFLLPYYLGLYEGFIRD